jgi:Arc/MetJ-type ribon-helix-helix transcriptional regulator
MAWQQRCLSGLRRNDFQASFLTVMQRRNKICNSFREFAMTRTFTAELNQFIQDELETGDFANEDAVLTAALEVFREVRQRHTELRERVQESLTQSHAGETSLLDMNQLRQVLTTRIDQLKG